IQFQQRPAPIVVGRRVAWPERDCLVAAEHGVFESFQFQKRPATIAVCLSEIGLEGDCSLAARDRLFQAANLREAITQIIVSWRKIGIYADRLRYQLNPLIKFSCIEGNQPHQLQGVKMDRIASKYLSTGSLGLSDPALLMQQNSFF